MRIVPLLDVFGFGLGPPALWPMGAGAGRPTSLGRAGGSDRTAFRWDEAGRLAVVEIPAPAGGLHERITDRWAEDGTLDRVEHDVQQEYGFPGPDGTPEYEDVWTWSVGLPVRVETREIGADEPDAVAEWAWSAGGDTARITESSTYGVLWVHTARFDAAGRLLCVDSEGHAEGASDRSLEVSWAPDGRILSARRREGPGLTVIREVTFEWADGRLLGQTSDVHGSRGRWIYGYEAEGSP